jgi:hypothetical protein
VIIYCARGKLRRQAMRLAMAFKITASTIPATMVPVMVSRGFFMIDSLLLVA